MLYGPPGPSRRSLHTRPAPASAHTVGVPIGLAQCRCKTPGKPAVARAAKAPSPWKDVAGSPLPCLAPVPGRGTSPDMAHRVTSTAPTASAASGSSFSRTADTLASMSPPCLGKWPRTSAWKLRSCQKQCQQVCLDDEILQKLWPSASSAHSQRAAEWSRPDTVCRTRR